MFQELDAATRAESGARERFFEDQIQAARCPCSFPPPGAASTPFWNHVLGSKRAPRLARRGTGSSCARSSARRPGRRRQRRASSRPPIRRDHFLAHQLCRLSTRRGSFEATRRRRTRPCATRRGARRQPASTHRRVRRSCRGKSASWQRRSRMHTEGTCGRPRSLRSSRRARRSARPPSGVPGGRRQEPPRSLRWPRASCPSCDALVRSSTWRSPRRGGSPPRRRGPKSAQPRLKRPPPRLSRQRPRSVRTPRRTLRR